MQSNDWYKKHGHYNPVKAQEMGVPIRISKSSFMQYLMCPRQFWWNYIALEDERMPPTPEMIRGTEVHTELENLYLGNEVKKIDPAIDIILDLEKQRVKAWGDLSVVEAEVKHEVFVPEYNVVLVGKIDGVLRHPDGGLVLVELKTGKMAKSKHSRTRKELCFYYYVFELMECDPITHFMFLSPDCTNEDFLFSLMENKKTEVFMCEESGLSFIEPINKRSLSAFQKSFDKAVKGLREQDWSMKWNDYFCTNWCDFNMACQTELIGG